MPRYTNEAGVVVDIPAELAERLGGYTPVEAGADHLDPDDITAWLDAEDIWRAIQDANVAEWLAAEESYHADVTAWLNSETVHALAVKDKSDAARNRSSRRP